MFTEVVVRSSVVGILVFNCDDVGCTVVVLRLIVVDVVSSVVFGSLNVFGDSVVASIVVLGSFVGKVVFDCDIVGFNVVILGLIVVDVVSPVVFGPFVVFEDNVVASPVVVGSFVGKAVFGCDDVGYDVVFLRLIVVDVVSSVVFGSLVVFWDSVVTFSVVLGSFAEKVVFGCDDVGSIVVILGFIVVDVDSPVVDSKSESVETLAFVVLFSS